MSHIWNLCNVSPPPNFTHETARNDRVVGELIRICSGALQVLNKLNMLHKEGAVMSRIIYKNKWKFHKDVGFQKLEKVNRALRRYLSLNMENAFSDFCPRSPELHEVVAYLPSCQMLEWLLVKIQSFARLFCYAVQCCETAGHFLKLKLSTGHTWGTTLLFIGLVSRIWVFSKYLVLQADEWYKKLKPYLKVLPKNALPWLPPDYEFPSDIISWLGSESQVKPILDQRLVAAVNPPENDLQLIDQNDGDSADLIMLDSGEDEMSEKQYVKKSKNKIKKNSALDLKKAQSDRIITQVLTDQKNAVENIVKFVSPSLIPEQEIELYNQEDIGCSISRRRLKSLLYKRKFEQHDEPSIVVPKKSQKKLRIPAIKNHEDVAVFISSENKLRSQTNKQCVTRNMDKLQWHMLERRMKKFIRKLKKLDNKPKYSRLIQKVKEELEAALS